jgi:peptidyl-dipeptidase A
MRKFANLLAGMVLALILAACSQQTADEPATAAAPTETADEFIARVNDEFREYWRELNAAGWLRATYINEDSGIVDALANQRYAEWHTAKVAEAKAYDDVEVSAETRRALNTLKLGALMVAPDDDAKRKEQATILTELGGMYGAGKYCRDNGECFSGNDLELLMQQTRDYDELLEYWAGWRAISVPMRDKYQRFTELANEGANGFGSRPRPVVCGSR